MTTPEEIRAGLKAALSTAAFTAAGFQAQDYITVPIANIIQFFPGKFTYFPTEEQEWVVQAFTANIIDKAAQMRLDELLASSGGISIRAALESDDTLGGRCSELKVIDAEGHQVFEGQRGVAYGSTWTVHLLPN